MMTEDIRDIKGIIGVWDWGTFLFLSLCLCLILLLLLSYFIFRYLQKRKALLRKHKIQTEPPPRPFYQIAEEALLAIDPVSYFEKGKIKEFYFVITEIVRRFLGQNYLVDTMDRTSFEIIEAIERMERDFEKVKIIDAYFEACDLVKFAKDQPGIAELREAKNLSLKIVKERRRAV